MPATDVTALVARLDASVSSLTRAAAVRRLYRRVAGPAGAEIERSSYLVLKQLVEDGPVRITDLAAVHGVEPSTMSRHVSGLVDLGLLTKRPDPADGRAALAEATPAGAELVEKVEAQRHHLFTAILTTWEPSEAEQFVDLIERFNDAMTDLIGPA